MLALSSAPQVHLINPLTSNTGGSEWRTLTLYKLLNRYGDTHLWSEFPVHPALGASYPIQRIDEKTGQYPKGGVLVFVGVYYPIGSWLSLVQPLRTIVIINTFSNSVLPSRFLQLKKFGIDRVEVVFASEWLKRDTGLPGVVQLSIIELDRFFPTTKQVPRPFTVGRLSRDVSEKHHQEDIPIYRALAASGCQVRLMGGTCLNGVLGDVPGIELLPEGAEDSAKFLHSLDCFYYRTSDTWPESFGRVVAEAMASGLPVVCYREGGYAEFINSANNGFLFGNNDEALSLLYALKDDALLRSRISTEARRTMENLYSYQSLENIADYYREPYSNPCAFDLAYKT